jgi:Carboxypeptidase regulatory-like domain
MRHRGDCHSLVPLFAQSHNANINGPVSDPSSAAVAGAEIVAVNDVTGVQYTTKTNNEGIYDLPNLPPGRYRVQVSKIGFKTLIKPDIVLDVQDSLSINFTLLVGAFHEIVTVQGGAPLVNTESAAVSTVIDRTYVENMPLNG